MTRPMRWPLRLALAWHVLGGITTLVAGALWLLGWPIVWAWWAVVLGVALAARQVVTAPAVAVPMAKRPTAPTVHLVARVVVVLAAISVLATAWTTLLPDWDGMAIWGLKAKLLAMGAFDAEWLRAPIHQPAHPEYPLHVPMRGALVAQLVGWHDNVFVALTALDMLAIALLIVGFAERWRPTWLARVTLIGVLAVPALWLEVPRGYADVTVALALTATLVMVERWLRHGERRDLYLAGLAAGVGGWAKQEGLVLLLVVFGVAWLVAPWCSRQRRAVAWAAAIGVAWVVPWQLVRAGFGVATEPFGWRGVEQFQRLPTIAEAMAVEMLDVSRWSVLWLVAGVAFGAWLVGVWVGRRFDSATALPALVLIAGLGAWTAIYVATPHDVEWHLRTSLHRLLVQLAPAAMLLLVAMAHRERGGGLALIDEAIEG